MNGAVYLEMSPALRERFGLPAVPFPVRREQLAAVMPGGELRPDLLLDELDRFLAEHPEQRGRYAAAGALLACVAGVALGREGWHPAAAHCFEIGLALSPEDLGLRLNYALALIAGKRLPEALRQLDLVTAGRADAGVDPLLWTLSARLCLDLGQSQRAARLLGEVAALLPAEAGFWDLLAEAEERAGLLPEASGTAPAGRPAQAAIPVARLVGPPAAPAGKPAGACPRCSRPAVPGASFCAFCGRKVVPPAPPGN